MENHVKTVRILFLSSANEMVGTYWRAFFLSRYLVKEGHKVVLIATSAKPTSAATKKLVDDVHVYLLPRTAFRENLLLRTLSKVSTVFMQTLLNCVLDTSDFDILHSFDVMGPHNATPTVLCKMLRILRIRDRKIFVDWDDWWGRGGMYGLKLLGMHGGEPQERLVAPLVTFLEEKVPLCADAVTVINETLRERALGVGVKSENLFVIPNGANVESIKPVDRSGAKEQLDLPKESIIYGHFGHLDVESFKLLILAHKKVLEYFPNALLLLYRLGQDLLVRLSESFMKSLQNKNVVFIGWQPYDKYMLYLSASDIFLLPMHDNIFNRARCPLRLGDYLAAGRPTVATAMPEVERVLGECGLVAKPGDSGDFADRILEIVRDPDLGIEMGKRARDLAETKCSWRIFARKLVDVYSQYI